MTLDALIAGATGAKPPAQIIRPPAFARAPSAGDTQAELMAHTAEKIRTTYMDGWEAGFVADRTIARAAIIKGALSGATVAIATALLAIAAANL